MQHSKSVVSVVATALVCIAGSALPLSAAHAEMKIGVVNFAKLADESPQAKELQATLSREFGKRQRDLVQQGKDLKAKSDKLQRDAAIMSDAEKSKTQRDLVDGQRELQRRENEFKEDVELRKNEELQKLQRVLVAETQAYAKSQGYDLVLSTDMVIYRKDAVDITSQVIAAVQAKSAKDDAGSGSKP